MTELFEKEFRTIIEDARTRHAAVIGLIYTTDAQSISLLRLYATLGMASASGATAGFGQSALLPRPAAWALMVGAISFVVGAYFCLRALRPSPLNLPGRQPDFWQWALTHEVDQKAVLSAYLENLSEKAKANNTHNKASSDALKWAKRCAIVAPVLSLAAGAASRFAGL